MVFVVEDLQRTMNRAICVKRPKEHVIYSRKSIRVDLHNLVSDVLFNETTGISESKDSSSQCEYLDIDDIQSAQVVLTLVQLLSGMNS